MRTSKYLLATQKETPADAVVISHKLMLRAGLIRKLASGLYTWLPTGYRVLRKTEAIIREEMERSGALEVSMPVVQNAELWQKSGRWNDYGAELLRFQDRHHNNFVLGPTHEEVITDLIRTEINSYKQLPLNLYQIQTKFRDEIRPRFGVMRSREFVMKDAYSFHLTQESLGEEYQNMYQTYCAVFEKLGLNYRIVDADNGSIGGSQSHEFHLLAASGEDTIVFSDGSDYAANIEKAAALSVLTERKPPTEALNMMDTPDVKTIAHLMKQFSVSAEKTVKTLIVAASDQAENDFVALMVRGDHILNEIKAANLPEVAAPLTFATEKEIKTLIDAGPGSLGPVGLSIACIVDRTVAMMSDFITGANINGKHYTGVNWERDAHYLKEEDLRSVVAGDQSPDGKGKLFIKRGIEAGHIFELGKKYSDAMNATVLDVQGQAQKVYMGCYGLGVTRIVAAAIEQNYDDRGIVWPDRMAPFQVALVGLKIEKSEAVKQATEEVYQALVKAGIEVLMDDRKASPGVKLADMELIGIPHRLIISEKGLAKNKFEYKYRRTEEAKYITPEEAVTFIIKQCDSK